MAEQEVKENKGLTWQIIRRKVYRMLGLVLPFIYLHYTRQETIYVFAMIAMVAMAIESVRFSSGKAEWLMEKVFSPVGKKEEVMRISGTTYFILGSLLATIFFKRVIVIPILFFLVLGDAFATIVGLNWGKTRIFGKSLEGSLGCLAACLVTGFFLLSNASLLQEGLTLKLMLEIAFFVTILELLPIPCDDNFYVPIGTGWLVLLFSVL
ncbi:MAG: hypothetical protein U9P49_07155 [Thermodesulfobacteriota bacterium]|nr:hypothetical protein [Thermodesulfobacteriota bacterium]